MDSIGDVQLLGEREREVTTALWKARETFLEQLTAQPHVQQEIVSLMRNAGTPGVRLDSTFDSDSRSSKEYRSVVALADKVQAVLDAYSQSPDDPSITQQRKEAGALLLQCRLHFRHYMAMYRKLAEEQAAPAALTAACDAYVSLKQELVEGNLALGIFLAQSSRYLSVSLPLEDRINAANVALLHAADRFDPRRGTKFATYATWWIRLMIDNAVRDDHAVPASHRIRRQKAAFERVSNELSQGAGHTPTVDDVCGHLGLSRQDLCELLPFLQVPGSLDAASCYEDSGRLMKHDLPGREPETSAEAHRRIVCAVLHEELAQLDERSRHILLCRTEETLQAIGQRLGLSRERIRQIEAGAREQLRQRLQERLPSLSAARDNGEE